MRRHGYLRAFAAVLSAYGLVLQAVLLGLVLGVTAAPSTGAPAAWAVLCNNSGLASSPDGAPAGQKGARVPACCVAGACGLSFGLPGAPVGLPPVFALLAHAPPHLELKDALHPGPRGHLPQARAPPAAFA